MTGAAAPRAAFRDVFAVREFRAVWFSEILSVAGDRLALVALTLLVYDRTRSPLLTALAYASGYLPWIIGGLFLAGLADRYPRRAVMVTCDMARAVLVTAMVIPGLPVLAWPRCCSPPRRSRPRSIPAARPSPRASCRVSSTRWARRSPRPPSSLPRWPAWP